MDASSNVEVGQASQTRYKEAVERLNSLQSNAATLSKAIAIGRTQSQNIEAMTSRLKRSGYEVEDLAKLNVIHIAGTKGKGSTCAYAESLLRHRGFKTGFYSSPHLIEVRERIRIDGRPLSKEKFVEHFWTIYNKLESTKDQEGGDMPPYFGFLTLLGFHVFLREGVDVALLEVGIGGRFDCTNVISAPIVCGITSLGHDHMSILGNTLEEIAWNKAGIIKRSCRAVFTSQGQPPNALAVLHEEAEKNGKQLHIAPPFQEYALPPSCSTPPLLGIGGAVQCWNASLALQLTETWRRWRRGESSVVDSGAPFPLDDVHLRALANTRWFGRCSIFERSPRIRVHLDGAHTPESIAFAARWFGEVSTGPRLLVFNVLGERNAREMFLELQGLNFDYSIFCPNIVHASSSDAPAHAADSQNVVQCALSRSSQLRKCQKLLTEWRELMPEAHASCVNSVEEALSFLEKADTLLPPPFSEASRIDVLVTGSLHLVGDFYALLSPEMNEL